MMTRRLFMLLAAFIFWNECFAQMQELNNQANTIKLAGDAYTWAEYQFEQADTALAKATQILLMKFCEKHTGVNPEDVKSHVRCLNIPRGSTNRLFVYVLDADLVSSSDPQTEKLLSAVMRQGNCKETYEFLKAEKQEGRVAGVYGAREKKSADNCYVVVFDDANSLPMTLLSPVGQKLPGQRVNITNQQPDSVAHYSGKPAIYFVPTQH